MNRILLAGAALILGITMLSACTPQGGNTPEGTWYEQNEDGSTLTITKTKITYTSGRYTFDTAVKMKNEADRILLESDPTDFIYVDMYYDRKEDTVYVHSQPHTDGDGGYHLIAYKRTKWTAPAPVSYPPADDRSDPNAQKEFADLTIRSMKVSFYDPGPYHDPDSSMALPLPYADQYSYDLTVQEDGSSLVSSSFCQEIRLSKEKTDELQKIALEADLGRINGIDIHTEGLPYDSPSYQADIILASGETIRSSANGSDVPAEWLAFQEPMHHLLFFAFIDAGYETSGEFHSTEPMKRVWADTKMRESTGITCENRHLEPNIAKSYQYSLYSSYFIFHDEENRYPVLMKTLDSLSSQYRKTAEEQLKKDHEMMEQAPQKDRKKDRISCRSLYSVDQWSLDDRIFSFMISEGWANSLGLGESGYGRYRNVYYHVDTNTGKILSLKDLFRDEEELYRLLYDQMQRFGTHTETGRFIHSDEFPAALRSMLDAEGEQAVGFRITYKYLELWFPEDMFPGTDSAIREVLYYEDIQDLLKDEYAAVR